MMTTVDCCGSLLIAADKSPIVRAGCQIDRRMELPLSNSLLDAIKNGIWNYEPGLVQTTDYSSTEALPGSGEKLDIMAERLRLGLPLWHPADRRDCEGLFKD
jgi:hypothetical protein